VLERASARTLPLVGRMAEVAPVAPACCNVCRTCMTTNLAGLLTAGATGAAALVVRAIGRLRSSRLGTR
jgi:hypothetical protein